ncbi:helix-turn-helix transcriptional regulator [uncultured Pontibacter sp.]|uniref:helix-turn-helix domain-containing protein n=1 Tax=uncultured Pontibacter sp. TaxID=453356 RepID=UPI00260E73A9|nr:helix-turn-helix transcriptional regulator [uncultured Pontibacter sp.]
MTEIHNKIKSIRLSKKLTQEDVAQKLGMSKANYSRIEKGDVALTPEKLEILQEVFGMSSEEIRNHETAQERLGLTNSNVLEETIKQQAAQIERMQANTEHFLEALVKHFQNPALASTLETKDTPMDAMAAVFNIDGLAHILNKENTFADSPLLHAYNEYKKAQLLMTTSYFIDALNKDLKSRLSGKK